MSDEFKVQWSVSLPPAAQYAKGDMLNLRGNSVEEVEVLFDQVLSGDFIKKAADVSALFRAAQVVAAGLGETATADTAAAAQPAQPAQQVQNNVTALKTCAHGVRERKSGTSKKGTWVGYFCPQPKGAQDKCDPIWED